MDTKTWGPNAWAYLHGSAAALPTHLPPRMATAYSCMLGALRHVLPCVYCRCSMGAFAQTLSLHPRTRADAEATVWELHNRVNAKLWKPRQPFEMAQTVGRTSDWRAAGFNFLSYIALNLPRADRDAAVAFARHVVASWPDTQQRAFLTERLPKLRSHDMFGWLCQTRCALNKQPSMTSRELRPHFEAARVRTRRKPSK